jgi:hypothetical protein
MLVARLGWRSQSGRPVPVAHLTVKAATALQLGPLLAERREKHGVFVKAALGVPSVLHNAAEEAAVTGGVKCMATALRRLWKLRWDNKFKEIYWRLVLDGLPTAQRMHMAGNKCMCGSVCPGCVHHFWECPVAKAVIDSLLSALPATWCTRPAGRQPLSIQRVWLMQRPSGPKQMLGSGGLSV